MGIVERVEWDADKQRDWEWYLDLPAVRSVRESGVDLDPRVTVIVGENGSGKSTFVEAIATQWGHYIKAAVKHWSPRDAAEDTTLHWALVLRGERPRPHGGCFLRAEAMHALFGGIDADGEELRAFGGQLNTRSHGESFLAYLESRQDERGLFVLDEPEAALSFTSCLRLVSLLDQLVANGSQVIMATHSPVLAAFPDATVLEFGEHGIHKVNWADLELVQHWQSFLDSPERYFRHLLER